MKEYWNELKDSNEKMFKSFIELMESLKLSKNNDLACAFREDELMLIYYVRTISERKIVAQCKPEWLKNILQKIFPDKITFEPKATVMEYHLIIGFIEEFCRHFGYEVSICKSPDANTYYYSINWQTQSSEKVKPISHIKSFKYSKHVSYEAAQRGAMIECFKMIPVKKRDASDEIVDIVKEGIKNGTTTIEEVLGREKNAS